MRAGAETLSLLSSPRVFPILRSLKVGPEGRLELRRAAGFPAQSTLRSHLRNLERLGLIERHRLDAFPGTLEYALTDTGRELLAVATTLERWLARSPGGPLTLGEDAARAATKGLVDAWTTTVLPALAARPLSLTELDKQIATASYPTIERCLEALRLAEQIEVGKRKRSGLPYSSTDWLRRGLAPLAHAARWEYAHEREGAAPLEPVDVEQGFAVVAPLLDLPQALSGVCQVSVSDPNESGPAALPAFIAVREGVTTLDGNHPDGETDAWASGSIESWFAAVIGGDMHGLELSGERELAIAILDRVRQRIFADLVPAPDT